MKKHRGFFVALGLIVLLGLSAQHARAAPMTLTVFLNGNSIYSLSGNDTSVTANIGNLNTLLNGTGYSFSSLSGSSNFPGSNGPVGGYISDAGDLTYAPGGTGGVLTISVTGPGFTAPISGTGSMLTSAATANYSNAAAGSASPLTPTYQQYSGTFTDSTTPTAVTVTTPTITQPAHGTAVDNYSNSVASSVPLYVTPYTLSSSTVIDMRTPGNSTTPANDAFTGKTSLTTHPVPEPASFVMMLTGMPLPLVVMGLLRRRRAAA
jgi:hypothetical protein